MTSYLRLAVTMNSSISLGFPDSDDLIFGLDGISATSNVTESR